MLKLSESFDASRSIYTLVENKTSFQSNKAELHIFETHEFAESVFLKFSDPVVASMIKGKKVMHLRDSDPFDFYPGESVVLPCNEVMCIDFPEANDTNPTKCLALSISNDELNNTLMFLNETKPKLSLDEWTAADYNFHLKNDLAIDQLLQRMIYIFTENHSSKDIFLDFILRELLIRIFQTENRIKYENNCKILSNHSPMGFVINFIKSHLHEKIKISDLARKAYMSETNFFRVFKNETGLSPVDFINKLRLEKALHLLKNPNNKIKDILIETGFESHSYFNRVFKMAYNLSPSDFLRKTPDNHIHN
jgi:AraC family transcriptional regulator